MPEAPLTSHNAKRDHSSHGVPYFPQSSLVAPHVESFNFFYDHGLAEAVSLIRPLRVDKVEEKNLPRLNVWIGSATISKPTRSYLHQDTRLMPNECREMHVDYAGEMHLTIKYTIGGAAEVHSIDRKVGMIPLMVKSSACHLKYMNGKELIAAKEEATELGGYFILNGNEKIIRMLIVPRRNQLVGMVRPSWGNRGKLYTKFGVSVRSGRSDMTTQSCILHYLSNGSCNLRISVNKQEMFIPAIILLRCLRNVTDKFIFDQLVEGEGRDDPNLAAVMASRGESVIREGSHLGFRSQTDNLTYLGKNFRSILKGPESETDLAVGKRLLQEYVLVHCEYSQMDNTQTKPKEAVSNQNKFNSLVLMMKKLYNLVDGRISPDNPDALDSHELLLPGHLYTMVVKEQIQRYLIGVGNMIRRSIRQNAAKVDYHSDAFWTRICNYQIDIGRKLRYFMSTGNLISATGLDLMQTTGFTIMADKLNYMRWISHFRSIHRGQFFTTMKTTTVRKLLPEQWGYVCPVHTPDGGPCGLLNHIAALCLPVTHKPFFSRAKLIAFLTSCGMSDLESGERGVARLPVQLDGVLLGRVPEKLARSLVDQLRYFKVVENGDPRLENTRTDWVVPPSMEIDAVLDYSDKCFPGVRLYTEAGRMVRPVRYLLPEALRKASQDTEFMEMLGPCEQTNMEIAVAEDDFRVGETTHMEYAPEAILSMIAGMTPFSDFNQSPRNMYQCQMGKQTMGTPCHSFQHRTDNKMYRIQNPQRPLVYNDPYSEYAMNEYPMGTNAVVAVISYTGYDMEDACIINKSSYERGFMHASVYKTARVDLGDLKAQQSDATSHVFRSPAGQEDAGVDNEFAALDSDGLPFVGDRKNKGDPMYNVHSEVEEKDTTTKYKSAEACAIDEIRLNGGGQSRKARLQKVSFKYRLNRNPVIGDKFASRHGQKGVLSMLWPQHDMPFTENGMYPDLIINPHAFPSRMTIGMLIESLAGKSAALHGIEQNSTPFQYRHTGESDTDPGPVEYFGEQLAAAGFNYAGTEPLYSGVSGQEMKAEIYIGVIYYQRLRHMVKDKFQVRATGPVNRIHRQPVKGRKVGGGIRFGEMERDSMLGHGTSFLLHDRLMACSDYHVNYVCKNCGSALSASQTQQYVAGSTQMPTGARVICRTCASGADVVPVALPFVFLYLLNELAAMNIKLTLEVK